MIKKILINDKYEDRYVLKDIDLDNQNVSEREKAKQIMKQLNSSKLKEEPGDAKIKNTIGYVNDLNVKEKNGKFELENREFNNYNKNKSKENDKNRSKENIKLISRNFEEEKKIGISDNDNKSENNFKNRVNNNNNNERGFECEEYGSEKKNNLGRKDTKKLQKKETMKSINNFLPHENTLKKIKRMNNENSE